MVNHSILHSASNLVGRFQNKIKTWQYVFGNLEVILGEILGSMLRRNISGMYIHLLGDATIHVDPVFYSLHTTYAHTGYNNVITNFPESNPRIIQSKLHTECNGIKQFPESDPRITPVGTLKISLQFPGLYPHLLATYRGRFWPNPFSVFFLISTWESQAEGGGK